jgi:hypothetical protein
MRARPLMFLSALLAAIVACFLFITHWPAHSSASSLSATSPRQPVIVELFTSEGCSSCPPADALLKKLAEDQPFDGIEILPLEEHVDYWNTLGWSDPFSSVDFSRRQEQYAVSLPDGGIYTPQIVVDGRAQFVGNRTHESRDQIRWAASHPKARILLTPVPNANPHTRTFQLTLSAPPYVIRSNEPHNPASAASSNAGTPPTSANPSSLELWISVTEKDLHSDVTSGENSGHTLQHAPVVRLLRKENSDAALSPTAHVSITIDLNDKWNPAYLTAIAFLSDPHSHQIQAAGSSPF